MSAPAQKPKQTSRWGSLLQGAVAGIESRLDTILAEDDQASARSRAVDEAAKQAAAEKAAAEKARLQQEQGRQDEIGILSHWCSGAPELG
jgi:hypothetical protein